ncbi:hypothetical protein CPB83DRAFT_858346 [Crepidotus variabilis]|uniref:DUF6534 domain-containing protein n=1 Tax=Crepidotus variabilis TaxID=179855 RepID=A0A9P6EBW5_9AGAR|nr:hypothetical protein CPB83DRAFT_858346 [Crepidotus variabilis]
MSDPQELAKALLKVSGPLLIGHLLNWGLFGVLSVQVYIYHLAFPNDHIRNKALSYSVYVLEIVQTMMLTQSAFHAFAEGFGNVEYMMEVGNLWFSVPILSGMIFFITQMFYAYRVHRLSGSSILAGVVIFFALVSFAGAIATGALSRHVGDLTGLLSKNTFITLGIWNGGNAVCDAIIAICMTVSISRRSTGLPQSQALVNKIIRLTVETGSLTAAVAILNLILILLPDHAGYFLAPIGILGKLYSTSMMSVFNSRIVFSDGGIKTLTSASAVDLPRTNWRAEQRGSANRPVRVAVKVTQEQLSFPSNEQTSFWEDKTPVRRADSFQLPTR